MLDTRWPNKPPPGTLIDWSQEINTGLALEWAFNEGSGPCVYNKTSLAANATGTFSSTSLSWSPRGVKFPAGDYRVDTGVTVPFLPFGPSAAWGMEIWLAITATVQLCTFWGFGAETLPSSSVSHDLRFFMAYGGSSPYNVYFWGGSSDWATGVNWITDGAPHQYVLTTPGGSTTPTISLYVDGVFRASGTPGNPLASAAAGGLSEVCAGGRHSSGTGSFVGQFIRGRIWSRCLQAAEIQSAYLRPWASYRPGPARDWAAWMGSAAGGHLYGYSGTGGAVLHPLNLPSSDLYRYRD